MCQNLSSSKRAAKFVFVLGSLIHAWFYSVFRGEIETKTTFWTFLTVFSSLIWSAMISMYGWREPLIHLNMMQDRIEQKTRETVPTESKIQSCRKAWFSMSIVPMDSSKSQCLWDTVKAKTKNYFKYWHWKFFWKNLWYVPKKFFWNQLTFKKNGEYILQNLIHRKAYFFLPLFIFAVHTCVFFFLQ